MQVASSKIECSVATDKGKQHTDNLI